MAVDSLKISALNWIWEWRGPTAAKIGVLIHVASDFKIYFFPQHLPLLFYSLMMITHATGLSTFLDRIRSPAVVYNVEEQN